MLLLENKKLNALAKNISMLIKRNCTEFLSEIKPEQIVFKGIKVDGSIPSFRDDITEDLFLIKSIEETAPSVEVPEYFDIGQDRIFELLQSSVRGSNALTVSGNSLDANKSGDVYVIFPLDDMEYVWSDLINDSSEDYMKDPLPYKKYFLPNDEKIKDLIEAEINNAFETVSENIFQTIRSRLKIEWLEYFENEARNYVARQPINDTDHYADENFIKTLAFKWFEKHISEFENTVQKRTDIEILDDVHQKEINRISDEVVEQLMEVDFFNYHNFDEDEFVKLIAPSYHTNKLSIGIVSGHEILIKCDKYYAIESNFFDLYIRERLWH